MSVAIGARRLGPGRSETVEGPTLFTDHNIAVIGPWQWHPMFEDEGDNEKSLDANMSAKYEGLDDLRLNLMVDGAELSEVRTLHD